MITVEVEYSMANLVCVALMGPGADELTEADIAEAISDFTKKRSGSFQERGAAWLEACFGESNDPLRKTRRMHRFVEESTELAQALGCSKEDFLKLVDYVYGRPVGEPYQEVGGVMLTLVGVCVANELDLMQCAETELDRVWTKVEAIRAKNARQLPGSPLPGYSEPKSAYRIDVAWRQCQMKKWRSSKQPFKRARIRSLGLVATNPLSA